MSLEDSMAALAKSNLTLAEAQSALAEAQKAVADKYDEMIAFFAANNAAPEKSDGKAEDKPKRGRPKKAASEPAPPPADTDDGLGDDDTDGDVTARTSDEVKAILKKYKDAGGVPRDIMSKFGAKAFPELKEPDFNACYAATEKALEKL